MPRTKYWYRIQTKPEGAPEGHYEFCDFLYPTKKKAQEDIDEWKEVRPQMDYRIIR